MFQSQFLKTSRPPMLMDIYAEHIVNHHLSFTLHSHSHKISYVPVDSSTDPGNERLGPGGSLAPGTGTWLWLLEVDVKGPRSYVVFPGVYLIPRNCLYT
jgi:hypothetical protein